MKKTIICLMVMSIYSVTSFCNTDNRSWQLANGKKINAELVSCDLEKKEVVLRINEKEEKVYSIEDFSLIDTAWLIQWVKVSENLEKLLKEMKGSFNHYQHHGKYISDFYVYTPSKYEIKQDLPMLILFHPGGKGMRYLQRFMKAAEKLGIIIVSSDSFRNSNGDTAAEKRMLEIFTELLPTIEETVPHDKTKLYMGGSSGGAWRAYHYSVQVDREWAGIFANGGWLGGSKYYDLPYPEGMRVAIINGNNDKAANSWVKKDVKVLAKNGCNINIFAFEGGHQVPPIETQIEAIKWLINDDAKENANSEDQGNID